MGNCLCSSFQQDEVLSGIAEEVDDNPEHNENWAVDKGQNIVCIRDLEKTSDQKPIYKDEIYHITELVEKKQKKYFRIDSVTSLREPLNIRLSEIKNHFKRGSDEIFHVGDCVTVNADFMTSSIEPEELKEGEKLEIIEIHHNGAIIVKRTDNTGGYFWNRKKPWILYQPIKRANFHHLDLEEKFKTHVNPQLHNTWVGQSFLTTTELTIYIREPIELNKKNKKALANNTRTHGLSSNAPLVASDKELPKYSYLEIFAVHTVYDLKQKRILANYFIVLEPRTNHTYFIRDGDVLNSANILKLNSHDNFIARQTFKESIAYKKSKSKRSKRSSKFNLSKSMSSFSSGSELENNDEDKTIDHFIYKDDELVFMKYTSKTDDKNIPLLQFKRIKNTGTHNLTELDLQHFKLYISADNVVKPVYLEPHPEDASHTRDCIPFLIAPGFNQNSTDSPEETLQIMMNTLEALDHKVTYKEMYVGAYHKTAARIIEETVLTKIEENCAKYYATKHDADEEKGRKLNNVKIHRFEATEYDIMKNLEKVLESMDNEEDFLYLVYFGATDFNPTTNMYDLKTKGSGRPLEKSAIEELLFKYSDKQVFALFDCDNWSRENSLPLYGEKGSASIAFQEVAQQLMNQHINLLFLEYSIVEDLVKEKLRRDYDENITEQMMIFIPYPHDIEHHNNYYMGSIVYENDKYVTQEIHKQHKHIMDDKDFDDKYFDYLHDIVFPPKKVENPKSQSSRSKLISSKPKSPSPKLKSSSSKSPSPKSNLPSPKSKSNSSTPKSRSPSPAKISEDQKQIDESPQ